MLQEIYCEITEAAQDLAEKVAPNASTTEKEAIADAAVEKAEQVADAVAYSEEITEETYDALVETIAQCIYAETLGQLAVNQSCYALQEMFGEKTDIAKGALIANARSTAIGGAVGAGVGGAAGVALAKKKGKSKLKYGVAGALAGGTVGAGTGLGIGVMRDKRLMKKERAALATDDVAKKFAAEGLDPKTALSAATTKNYYKGIGMASKEIGVRNARKFSREAIKSDRKRYYK